MTTLAPAYISTTVPSEAPTRATMTQYRMLAEPALARFIMKLEPSRMTSGAKLTIMPSRVKPARPPVGVLTNIRSDTGA